MKKIIVPKSVKKYVAKQVAKRFLILAIGLAVGFLIIEMFIDELLGTYVGNWATFSLLILLVPFWISGVPLKLIDRSWYGTILSMDIKHEDVDNDLKNRRSLSQFSQHVLIKDSRGKLHYEEIFDEGEIFEGRDKYYKVGDRVVHVYGTEYIRPMHKEELKLPKVCVVCGHKSAHTETECQNCKRSLEIYLEENGKIIK